VRGAVTLVAQAQGTGAPCLTTDRASDQGRRSALLEIGLNVDPSKAPIQKQASYAYSHFFDTSHQPLQQSGNQPPVQLAGEALVLRLGLEAGDATAFLVGVELEVQADGLVDAADETHAGVGLFVPD